MPLRHLNPYIAAMPHVRAIASLSLAEAVAVGTGSMKQQAREETVRRWTRSVRRTRGRAQTPAEIALAAAAAGIGFRRVIRKRKEPPADG